MKRVVLGVVAAICAAAALGAPAARAHRTYPARLLVYAQEWTLAPSRATLPAGPIVVQLWNRGQDAHDLWVQRMTSSGAMVARIQKVRTTLPGRVSTAHWTLGPGRYMLFCSLPGHMAAGMQVIIRVRRG
jgi:uncharacterized cupredoxin-like copper-binding protein